jgi:glyceraldehyde 3-phosphate dehydrogenase
MSTRFAINGLGRIGRALLRIACHRAELHLVAINELASPDQLARLVARDSVHGPFDLPVDAGPGELRVGEHRIRVTHVEEPAQIPWPGGEPLVVVDATGTLETREDAAAHLREAVSHVVVSANLDDADRTVCLGVNDEAFDPRRDRVVSNASCTTNCMAPVARVLDRAFGLERGLLTTIHSYTRGQELLDGAQSDPRRSRAAATNLVPAATGAARAVALVMPELAGRLDAQAVRVPVPDGSMVQFVVRLRTGPSLAEVADAFRQAAAGPLAGILAVTDEELVSSDFLGDPHSAIVDLPLLQCLEGDLYRVVAWYDNEWGYATRLADLVMRIGERR